MTEPVPSPDDAVAVNAGAPTLDPTDRSFWIGLVVVLLSLVAALATYLILTGLTPIVPRNELVWPLVAINIALIAAMIGVISWQFAGLWRSWRDKVPGARLHVRIVAMFSIIATLPAMLLAVAATTTFSRSLDGWFSTRTRAIIENSLQVAQAYVDEHGQVIRTDIVNMARDLDRAADLVSGQGKEFQQLFLAQAGLRDLPFAHIIDRDGKPVVSASDEVRMPFRSPPAEAIAQAEAGLVPFLTSVSTHRVAAVAKLERFAGQYLYVARTVSPNILAHLQRTEESVDEYNRLRRSRGPLKLVHGVMYLMISMTALLAAIWSGMWFAGRFVAPIRRLIAGAQNVSRGNLSVELPEKRGEGDLRRLSQTFNTMTREIKHQRDALLTANDQLVERRRFMEAVLAGVSAGVMGIESDGRITLASRAAAQLLGKNETDLIDRTLAQAVPEFAAILSESDERGLKRNRTRQLKVIVGQDERTFAVRLTHEGGNDANVGLVLTFDDITELVSAQRTSAWADVAQRIAHEIKNPLTPIQLSTDRLRSKYGKQISEDRDKFDGLIDTISRRVGDIKTMVDEFAAFARVPKPVMERDSLTAAIQEPVILFRESHPNIEFLLRLPPAQVIGMFDRRLITQAVTNLVKNAAEAVESGADGMEPSWRGQVETILRVSEDRYDIEVIDNGVGLPKQNRSRLLEPYVTTKGHKGTGLGLAIVQKITEQHGGTLTLEDAPLAPGRTRGALVRITLPVLRSDKVSKRPDEIDPSQLPVKAVAARS
ncbi:MAG: PAS domain-containing sensor histidine kinase [Hyphomicrobium sp.]|nr:MAG: PAS domain-containing sensor histidine kinase [Hyphomicrobium sp.]